MSGSRDLAEQDLERNGTGPILGGFINATDCPPMLLS